MKRYSYQIYGATVETKDPLPGLTPVLETREKSLSGAKIFIESRNLPLWRAKKGWSSFYGLDYWFSPGNRFAVIQSPFVGTFRVHFREKRIDWGSVPKVSSEYTRAIMRVRIVGFLVSHLAPSLLLHASVVVRNGEGIAFGGVIAEGKSTLTAHCLNDGFSLLSDDIAAIQRKRGHFLLHPGIPEFRLWPGAASRLVPRGVKGERLAPEIKKKKFVLGPDTAWRFADQPVPLRTLYLLSRKRSGAVQIESLKGREALTSVLQNIYDPIVREPKILSQQFEMATWLIRKVPVKRLIYPSGFSHLPSVHKAILQDLKKGNH